MYYWKKIKCYLPRHPQEQCIYFFHFLRVRKLAGDVQGKDPDTCLTCFSRKERSLRTNNIQGIANLKQIGQMVIYREGSKFIYGLTSLTVALVSVSSSSPTASILLFMMLDNIEMWKEYFFFFPQEFPFPLLAYLPSNLRRV